MLPGLEPHHTRQSFCSGSRLYVEKVAPGIGDYIHDFTSGLWLVPEKVAENDRLIGIRKLGGLAVWQQDHEMEVAQLTEQARNVLSNTEINSNGCMIGGTGFADIDMTPIEWAIYFAEQEMGVPVINTDNEHAFLCVCSTAGCYNSRHFDFDFGKDRSVELNPALFTRDSEGITTVWGDGLPPLSASLEAYREFQKRNFPFVPIGESALTPSAVAYVRFHSFSGCWESWKYNRKPLGSRGGRFEGYGNLYCRERPEVIDPTTGEIKHRKRRGNWLAHRVIWDVIGNELDDNRVLNHLCNYKRCCNPLHIEQISEGENTQHGRKIAQMTRQLFDAYPEAVDLRLSPAERARCDTEARAMYAKLERIEGTIV